MTNDDIAYLRLLADWHDRQARYLLLTVPANIFHTGLPAPLSVIQARYVRLVASVLVVLDRTFDDAEELREFSLRYLAGFANFGTPLADAEIHAAVPLCVHHSLEGEHVHALRSRERGCFLVVQNSMGGKNSVNNRCRIAKHFRPK